MPQLYKIKDGRGDHYLGDDALRYPDMIGVVTPVTSDPEAALVTTKSVAEMLRDKCNRSPLAKWVIEPC